MGPTDAESNERSYINLVSIKGPMFILFCCITALNTMCTLTSLATCDNDTCVVANHAKLVNNRDYHNYPQVYVKCFARRQPSPAECDRPKASL